MFSITENKNSDGVVLVVHGSLDLANAPVMLARGRRSVATGSPLALDLSDVDVLDAIGIGVLLGLRKTAVESGGSFGVIAASEVATAALVAHEVDHLFPAF